MGFDPVSYAMGKQAGGGGGGVTVEPLSVTGNGTYTAPTGKAYSPVTVNVQPPAPVEPSDVNFIDYDGSVVYAYTASDFVALTELPANPTHEGLTSQGWNWTLADAKDYVEVYGGLVIGQTYATADGKTRIYITLESGRLSPYLGFGLNGTAVIEWGDGTSDTVTGSNDNALIQTRHDYAVGGDYVIAIAVTGKAKILALSSTSSLLLAGTSITTTDTVYRCAVNRIELGSNMLISAASAFYGIQGLRSITIPAGTERTSNYTFYNCYALMALILPSGLTKTGTNNVRDCNALKTVSLPKSLTAMGESTLAYASGLRRVWIPPGVTKLNTNLLYYCNGLSGVTVPASVTEIASGAFGQCTSLGFIRFLSETPPVVANSGAFTSVPTDCVIRVPSGTKATYEAATNYPDPATYTYVEE